MKNITSILILIFIFSCNQTTKINETKKKLNVSKELKKELVKTVNTKLLIPKNIEGTYTNSKETECKIQLIITKNGKEYFYKIKTDERLLNGKVSFYKNENEVYINFCGIEWAENNGELNENGEPKDENLKLPIGIEGLLNENEITIQNYGNSMNNYVKLYDCEDKYIVLKK